MVPQVRTESTSGQDRGTVEEKMGTLRQLGPVGLYDVSEPQ